MFSTASGTSLNRVSPRHPRSVGGTDRGNANLGASFGQMESSMNKKLDKFLERLSEIAPYPLAPQLQEDNNGMSNDDDNAEDKDDANTFSS